jgi:DNA-binding beta-propeller fold protein YncE
LVALAALWSCDGQNVFAPVQSISDGLAPVVEIQQPRAPAARPVGDSVLLVARASDDTGVDSILFAGVSFRGDVNLGTDTIVARYVPKMIRFSGAIPDTTISRYLVPTADTTREGSVLFAIAYDSNGNLSADTVQMTIGGPRVNFLTLEDNQQVQSGLSLNLQVEAADPEGILDLIIEVEGAFDRRIEVPFNPPPDSVRVDTVVVIPDGLTGFIDVTATARNGLAIEGQDGPVQLEIVDFEIGDETPPTVSVATISTERLELDDPISVVVSGADDSQGSGIARAGYTVKAISPRRKDTLVISADEVFNPARTGTQASTFEFLPFNVDHLALPDTLVFEITGWAVDGDGNCAAAVVSETPMNLPCGTLPGGEIAAEDRNGFNIIRVMSSGRTVELPSGGQIMDAAVDTLRRNLLLSNMERNRVEIFRLESEEFGPAIGVGSEPWGLTIDRSGDQLLVANSGGTNVSVVDLALEREVEQERFFAPDAIIFDLELEEGDAGLRYRVYPFPKPESPSFSDRPQFIAVDSFGNIIYSTRTTLVGDIGTARKAYFPEGAERSEVKLFVEHGANFIAEDFWAFAHLDSIGVGVDSVGVDVLGNTLYAAGLTLFDHVPGFPDSIIQATQNTLEPAPTENAWANLVAKGSDAFMEVNARWNIPSFGFSDTTFVTASGDGGWVLIGEGGTTPTGRVMMYRASQRDTTDLSSTLRVWDEVINASDRVHGVGLNYDGSLGVARGLSAYFFDTELQLNGRVELPGAASGTGAAMHPLHANQKTLENFDGDYRPDTHLAFVGTGDGTVDIIDTYHFTRIGQITLRDVITGPLRAILPFPEDNEGLTCASLPVTDQVGNPIGNAVQLYEGGLFDQPIPPTGVSEDDCVVVQLFAITSANGVVVVPVRKSEVLKYHPNR